MQTSFQKLSLPLHLDLYMPCKNWRLTSTCWQWSYSIWVLLFIHTFFYVWKLRLTTFTVTLTAKTWYHRSCSTNFFHQHSSEFRTHEHLRGLQQMGRHTCGKWFCVLASKINKCCSIYSFRGPPSSHSCLSPKGADHCSLQHPISIEKSNVALWAVH